MKVTVTGATGLIGTRLVQALQDRGDEVTVLTRDPGRARIRTPGATAVAWRSPQTEPAPTEALADRDAVVHLAGAPVAQRWTAKAKEAIRASRELGTRNLVAGIAAAEPRPGVLVSASGVDYYAQLGDQRLDEDAPAGTDFLAQVCVAWEREARAAEAHGVRVVNVRTGVVLAAAGGALEKMLTPFKLAVGGPVAGGRQYLPWVHLDDVVGIYLRAVEDPQWSGAVNAAAPEPVTNREFSKALGRALRRPAIVPVPALAIRLLYGAMAEIVAEGHRAVPTRALTLGYEFRHPELEPALRDALGKG